MGTGGGNSLRHPLRRESGRVEETRPILPGGLGIGMVVNLHCQLDWIWNPLLSKSLGLSSKVFSKRWN